MSQASLRRRAYRLASASFVAALFGDRVQAVFRVGGRLLMVVELAVQAGDPADRSMISVVRRDGLPPPKFMTLGV